MFRTDGPKLPPDRSTWTTTRQLCTVCGKDYCICATQWSAEDELKIISKKLSIIISMLNRRKHARDR